MKDIFRKNKKEQKLTFSSSETSRPIRQNCEKYSGEWYFQQQHYSWGFRVEMKTKYKDVILNPYDDAGKIDRMTASHI